MNPPLPSPPPQSVYPVSSTIIELWVKEQTRIRKQPESSPERQSPAHIGPAGSFFLMKKNCIHVAVSLGKHRVLLESGTDGPCPFHVCLSQPTRKEGDSLIFLCVLENKPTPESQFGEPAHTPESHETRPMT